MKGKQGNGTQLSAGAGIGFGLLLIVAGSVPILAAMGYIPSDDEDFHAPRWLVALLCAIFPAVGAWMLATGIAAALGPKSFVGYVLSRGAHHFVGWAVFAWFVALAYFLTSELFAPYPGTPPPLIGRIFDRFGYALGAIVVDLIVVLSLWHWVRQLFGVKEPPPKPEAGEGTSARRRSP